MPSPLDHRPSLSYNGFDTITEPGRRPPPMFLRRTKARRSRAIVLGTVCGLLLLIWGWRSSGIDITPSMARLTGTNLTSTFFSHIEPTVSDPTEPQQVIHDPEVINKNLEMSKNHKSFHLLIPASESNPEFCKTLLSAFVLGYPAPTLINWGTKSKDGKIFKESASHTAKVQGVHSFLSDRSKTKDDDMVLIVDGYDVWFQLPPKVLLERFNKMTEEADAELKRRYGMISEDVDHNGKIKQVQRYEQRVVFGADKLCWPNDHHTPACVAVPYSSLPSDIYGADTDTDPKSFHNRPRWLNSGNVMGRVRDVRAVYEATLERIDLGAGGLGDQYVFAEVFGEQEFKRETLRQETQGTGGKWLDYITDTFGKPASPLSANVTMKNVTTVPGRRYEFGIGLDYESQIFQTMTHSIDDIEFTYYNTSTDLLALTKHKSKPLYLPPDLQAAHSPLTYASPGANHSIEADPNRKTLLLPYSPNLDNLPGQNIGETAPSWRNIPLATNTYAASIPALLHINGDKSLLQSWWPRIWFHPFSRALLRRFIRSTQTPEAAVASEKGGEGWFDLRGGRGGVWTEKATWMSWDEVCHGMEDVLFDDGKGEFGKEEGDPRRVNSFGKVIIGEDE